MSDPRINLKNRHWAAVLAFLVPGAGHAYQRRYFKAVIYSVGILGLFFGGAALGEWKNVYFRWSDLEGKVNRFRTKERTIGYLSQAMVGLPALTALVQWFRYSHAAEPGSSPLDLP